jgi:23S rRNA (uracil1939-C5)-methyltransferase
LLHLITTDQGDLKVVETLAAHLREKFPEITTMVHSVSAKKAQVAVGGFGRTLWGPGYIEEQVLDRCFRISAESFFQTNTGAAEALYRAIVRLGDFTGRETVWDLYCGAGSIALSLADRVRRVVGFELVETAVQDAYVNSRLNQVDNCQFLAGDLKDCIQEALKSPHYPRPEIVITDPPRAGMHPQVIQALLELAPPRIIAVSCNPTTLTRDLALLQKRYEILTVEPFDLFPHTAHIECVVRLERKSALLE